MEILQAYSYSVIDECLNPSNQTATLLAYIHVSLQPIVANVLALHFVPKPVQQRIRGYVLGIAGLAAIAMLARLAPVDWTYYCYEIMYRVPFTQILYAVPFCGDMQCTTSGSWHLAWSIPAGHMLLLDYGYLFGVFLLPLLYGSWRVALYIAIVGPGLAIYLSDSANEFAAVWCLLSIGIIFIAIATPIRKHLYVNDFYGEKILFFKAR